MSTKHRVRRINKGSTPSSGSKLWKTYKLEFKDGIGTVPFVGHITACLGQSMNQDFLSLVRVVKPSSTLQRLTDFKLV